MHRSRSRLRTGGGLGAVLQQPSGFSWVNGPQVYLANGVYSTSFNVDANRPATTVTYYVDPVNGSDSNDGLSEGAPRAKLSTTVTLANAGGQPARILCKPGAYHGDQGWHGAVPTVNFILEPWAADPSAVANRLWMIRPPAPDAFVLDSGFGYRNTGFYINDPFAVLDRTSVVDGFPRKYEKAADYATYLATPGTWWRDTGTSRLYVRTFDSRVLSGLGTNHGIEIETTGGGNNLRFSATTDLVFWVQNACFIGGSNPIYIQPGVTGIDIRVYMKDCTAVADALADGAVFHVLQNDATMEVYLKRCGTAWNLTDGFDFRSEATNTTIHYFEDQCFTERNGYDASGANNATTAHGNSVGISLNGSYAGSSDRVVNDIQTCKRWMLGCAVEASAGSGATSITVQAGSDADSHTTQIWLDGCTVANSTTAAIHASANCAVRYTNMSISGLTVTGTGTVESY